MVLRKFIHIAPFAALLAAPSAAAGQSPMKLVVSLADQTMDVYDGDRFVERFPVSTGKAGHETPTGVFSILEKRRMHHSNIYSGAPMPFMQRLTWSGIALHAGRLPGYPASHGCIRLPDRVAANLFNRTRPGAHVIVARTRLSPVAVAHAALPQPLARVAAAPVQPVRVASLGAAAETANDAQEPAVLTESVAPEASESAPVPVAAPAPDAPAQQEEPVIAVEPPVEAAPAVAASAPETYSDAPVRVLLTRRSGRELLRDVQGVLAELGYDVGDADGFMGPRTGAAIGAFQASRNLPQTRAMSDDLVAQLYEAAGKGPAPTGHLYVRQDFKPVFDMPVVIADAKTPLGTHVLTAIEVDRGAQTARWTSMELERAAGPAAADAFSRFALPDETRQRLGRMLTQGSSIVITDRGFGDDTAPKGGTDFIVVTSRRM